MRHLLTAVLGIGMCAVAVTAQDGEPPAKPDAPKPDAPKVVEFTDLEKSPEAIKKGFAQLEKTSKAYRNALALTEDIIIDVSTPMGPQKTEIKSTWGPNDTYMISVDGGAMEMTSDGKAVYLELQDSPKKFIEVENDPNDPFKAYHGNDSGCWPSRSGGWIPARRRSR